MSALPAIPREDWLGYIAWLGADELEDSEATRIAWGHGDERYRRAAAAVVAQIEAQETEARAKLAGALRAVMDLHSPDPEASKRLPGDWYSCRECGLQCRTWEAIRKVMTGRDSIWPPPREVTEAAHGIGLIDEDERDLLIDLASLDACDGADR